MVQVYVSLYEKKLREIEQIPSVWQTDVIKMLNDKGTLREEDAHWVEGEAEENN